MSLIAETSRYVLSKIRGAASLPDQIDRATYAEFAHNVEIVLNDQVQTRRGFGAAWNPVKSITSMFNWILAGANRLAYYNKTDGKVTLRNLVTAGEVDLLTGLTSNSTVTVSFAIPWRSAGVRSDDLHRGRGCAGIHLGWSLCSGFCR